jgi:cysteine-rich repeat protein
MKFEFGCEDDTDSGAEENNDPVCGNEVVEEGEECDDGNSDNNDSCTNSCRNAKCGDAIKWTNMEECDDGNTNNNDSCTNDCKNASCGDGYVQSGEDCDDGNSDNNDSCTNQCLFPTTCGSGLNQVSVELETDLYGNSESQVYMFDRDRTAPAGSGDDYKWPDSDYAWVYRTGDLEKETTYDWTVCLEPSKCFVFYFFDDMGDGIEAGFLDLKVNDNRVLYVVPDSDSFELWMPDTSKAIYWYEEIGNC